MLSPDPRVPVALSRLAEGTEAVLCHPSASAEAEQTLCQMHFPFPMLTSTAQPPPQHPCLDKLMATDLCARGSGEPGNTGVSNSSQTRISEDTNPWNT